MSKKASSIFGDLVGQRFLSVASRRHGSKTIVAVTMVCSLCAVCALLMY